jgi:hypothetical protein
MERIVSLKNVWNHPSDSFRSGRTVQDHAVPHVARLTMLARTSARPLHLVRSRQTAAVTRPRARSAISLRLGCLETRSDHQRKINYPTSKTQQTTHLRATIPTSDGQFRASALVLIIGRSWTNEILWRSHTSQGRVARRRRAGTVAPGGGGKRTATPITVMIDPTSGGRGGG